MSWDFIYYRDMLFNEGYEETTFNGQVCLKARRLCRIFDNALLAVIGRLAAEEVGKTWLSTQQRVSLDNVIKSDNNTDSTISVAHRLLLIHQGLLRGQGGCGKMFLSL